MSTLAYPIDAAVARLKATPGLALVGLAPDYAALSAAPPRAVPAVYVLSGSIGSKPSYSGPPLQQPRVTRLTLSVWIENHGEPEDAVREMRELLSAIDAQFAGWTPGDAFGALTFKSSDDEFYGSAHLVQRVVYESAWTFSAPLIP